MGKGKKVGHQKSGSAAEAGSHKHHRHRGGGGPTTTTTGSSAAAAASGTTTTSGATPSSDTSQLPLQQQPPPSQTGTTTTTTTTTGSTKSQTNNTNNTPHQTPLSSTTNTSSHTTPMAASTSHGGLAEFSSRLSPQALAGGLWSFATNTTNNNNNTTSSSLEQPPPQGTSWSSSSSSYYSWMVLSGIGLSCILGYAMGAGWTDFSGTVSPWRQALGSSIRSSTAFQLVTWNSPTWYSILSVLSLSSSSQQTYGRITASRTNHHNNRQGISWLWWPFASTHPTPAQQQHSSDDPLPLLVPEEADPTHAHVFALLREAVIREKGGYVHADLGFLSPAPSGPIRGLGMVQDSYHSCQTQCKPGTSAEKRTWIKTKQVRQKCLRKYNPQKCQELLGSEPTLASHLYTPDHHETEQQTPVQLYQQEEVLLRIPLSYQMTRSVAIETLSALIPDEVQTKHNFHSLDDAALLTLLLAHERGLGRYSKWYPYLLTLPEEPTCGYSRSLRPQMLDALEAMRHELAMDVEGWSAEIVKAALYADRIEHGLYNDFGEYIQTPPGLSKLANLKWALCTVSSRATAGHEEHGSLRLVPLMDLINHDVNAGGFIELNGTERIARGDFVDAHVSYTHQHQHNHPSSKLFKNHTDHVRGTFVVRSLRHGQPRPLRKGQELLANYNVPLYTPLDWFILLGFCPRERWALWQKVDPVLPRVRRDGPFSEPVRSSQEQWERDAQTVLKRIRESEDLLF